MDYRDIFIEKYAMDYIAEKLARRLSYIEKQSLPESECGYVDESGHCHFPMPDEAHVRNAIQRFPLTKRVPPAKRAALARKILSKAKQYGIEVSPDSEVAKAAK